MSIRQRRHTALYCDRRCCFLLVSGLFIYDFQFQILVRVRATNSNLQFEVRAGLAIRRWYFVVHEVE